MELRGQHDEAGYAMAALLVAMSVMAILTSAAMPTWRQMSQREKETELIFRGQQYARAIGLFQRRAGPGVNPPNLDVLVQQKFLRKKYKDPITGDDFELISPTTAMSVPTAPTPGAPALPGSRAGASGTAATAGQDRLRETQSRLSAAARGMQQQPVGGAPVGFGGNVAGGIVGVQSKSKAESIRIYNGRTHYNEWQFVYVPQTPQPGAPGQRGAPQRGDPQRGDLRRGGPGFGNPNTFPPPGGGRQGSQTPPQPRRPF